MSMTALQVTSLPSTSPVIRVMTPADVPAAVHVHMVGFPGFFLTFLGRSFLRELYMATLTDQDGMGFVAEDNRTVCGFVVGTAQPAGFYSRLIRQRWWRFALASMRPVLRRPAVIPRLFGALSMPSQVTQREDRGTLTSIAVLPEAQGQGVGQALVRAFIKEASARNLRQVDLTTDRDDNEAANRFYQSLGFTRERTFVTPEGRAMNEYVIVLPNSVAAETR